MNANQARERMLKMLPPAMQRLFVHPEITEMSTLGPVELAVKKKAIRNGVMGIAWLKLLALLYYILLLILTTKNGKGFMSKFINLMIFLVMLAQIANAVFLLLAAFEKHKNALKISLMLMYGIGAYHVLLGVIGGIYFIRNGHLTINFFTAILFALLACSIIIVLCHDIVVIYTFQDILQEQEAPIQPESPRGDRPSADSPRVNTPRVASPRVDTPRVDSPRVDTPRVDTPRVDTPRADSLTPKNMSPPPNKTH